MPYKRIFLLSITLMLIATAHIACTNVPGSTATYDPAKSYAAFLILDSANGRNILDNLKERSLGEGYVIGPIEYYKLGSKDFDPIVKKLIPGTQVKLIWIASSLMDIPDIQKAIAKTEYKGTIRYMPATQSVGQ